MASIASIHTNLKVRVNSTIAHCSPRRECLSCFIRKALSIANGRWNEPSATYQTRIEARFGSAFTIGLKLHSFLPCVRRPNSAAASRDWSVPKPWRWVEYLPRSSDFARTIGEPRRCAFAITASKSKRCSNFTGCSHRHSHRGEG